MFGGGSGEDKNVINVRVHMDDDNGGQRTNFDQNTNSSLDPSALVS